MSKRTSELVDQLEENNKTKGKKKMKKINWETVKTVVIAILVTAIVAFVGGIKYQERFNDQVTSKAKELSQVVSRVESKQ